MRISEKLAEFLAVVGLIPPQAIAATPVYSDYVDMSKFEQVMGVIQTGDLDAKAINASLIAYTDTSASNPKTICSLTEIAAHASNNDSKAAVLNARRQDLLPLETATTLAAGGLRYVRLCIVSEASQTGPLSGIVLGGNANYDPASDSDLAAVVEIVG